MEKWNLAEKAFRLLAGSHSVRRHDFGSVAGLDADWLVVSRFVSAAQMEALRESIPVAIRRETRGAVRPVDWTEAGAAI